MPKEATMAIAATPPPVPPVVYRAGRPCRTVTVSMSFEADGRKYRATHLTWCNGGKRVTLRVKEVR
jgi:hypothetical protein